jgi:hypothetical protein
VSDIRRTDRVAFFGQTGSGKTELARSLWIGMAAPRVCLDIKNDLADRLPGIPTIFDPSAVREYETVRAVPPDPSDEGWYEEIYRLCFDQGDTLIWLDEANEITSPNYIPRGIRKYVLQGRSRGCGHFACTPRPADIHPTFAAQAGHIFVFRIRHPRDRKAIGELAGVPPAEVEETIDALPDWGFAHLEVATGEFTRCRPAHDPDELTARIASLQFNHPAMLDRLT